MSHRRSTRREFLAAAAVTLGSLALPRPALAKGSVTAAMYPGTWEEAFRAHVTPALKAAHDVDLEMTPLFAVDQIAKAQASRGAPPFDAFVLDPGPHLARLPTGMTDEYGVTVAAQVVGIGYNPKKLPKPKSWTDLLKDPWVSRLGMTGFQTTYGTVSIIEIAKQFGGSETNVEPFFVEIKKVLPKVAAIGAPASMPALFQQGQCDITYTNTQTVATLRGRDVDIEFVKPESGAVAFFTTMHIARGSRESENAYKYFDTVISAPVQSALMQPPNNFIPVNREVKLAANLPMASLDEMAKFVKHDWSKINPLRAGWIERFNKEVAK